MNPQQLTQIVVSHLGNQFGITNPGGPYGVGDYGECTAVFHVVTQALGDATVYGNAADCWNNAPDALFEKLPAGADAAEGDVPVWGENAQIQTTSAGHIAYLVQPSTGGADLHTFDQNWPTRHAPQYVPHPRTGLIGFLRPKQLTQGEDMAVIQALQAALDAERVEGVGLSYLARLGRAATAAEVQDWLSKHPSESLYAIDQLIQQSAEAQAYAQAQAAKGSDAASLKLEHVKVDLAKVQADVSTAQQDASN